MEFLDLLCVQKRSNSFWGADPEDDDILDAIAEDDYDDDDDYDEVDFDEDDESSMSSGSETETFTFTHTYDGSEATSFFNDSYFTGVSTGHTSPTSSSAIQGRRSPDPPTFQKTTPLFDAIDARNWKQVRTFLTKGKWGGSTSGNKLPVVPVKEEARQWSVTIDKSGKVVSRRLPIHAALMNQAPLDVIQKLNDLYPSGVSCTDSQGNLPLHLSFLFDANDAVVSFLLRAHPEAVLVKNYANTDKKAGGMLPMECKGKRKGSRKQMVKLCQEQARGLSLKKMRGDFEATSTKPTQTTQGLDKSKSKNSFNQSNMRTSSCDQERDLMVIKQELQELRRGASTGTSQDTHHLTAQNDNPLAPEAWVRSISNNFQDSFIGTALSGMAQGEEKELPAIEETLSNDPSTSGKGSVRNGVSLSRWKKSFQKRRSHKSNIEDDEKKEEGESVEVNLTTTSPDEATQATSASKSKKKRFSFRNPFKKSQKKVHDSPDSAYNFLDNVTVTSGPSKASQSYSKTEMSFSRSGTSSVALSQPDVDTSKSNIKHSSTTATTSTDTMKAPTTRAKTPPKRFFPKAPSKWLHRQHGTENGIASNVHIKVESNLSPTEEEKQRAIDLGIFSAWSMEKKDFAQTMTGLLLSNSPTPPHLEDEETSTQQLEDRNTKSLPRSNSRGSKKSCRSLSQLAGGEQQSFLENSFLSRSKSIGQKQTSSSLMPITKSRKKISRGLVEESESSDYTTDMDEETLSELSNSDDVEHTSDSGSHSSEMEPSGSVSDHDDQDNKSRSWMQPRISSGNQRRNSDGSSKPGYLPLTDKPISAPALLQRSDNGSGAIKFSHANPSRPGSEKYIRGTSEELLPSGTDHDDISYFNGSTSSSKGSKRMSFGMFRRKKSRGKPAMANPDVLKASTASPLKQSEQSPGHLVSSGGANKKVVHRRQSSVSLSTEKNAALSPLPASGDWRREYQEYLSTQSVAPSNTTAGSAKSRDRSETLSFAYSDDDTSKGTNRSNRIRGLVEKRRDRRRQKSAERKNAKLGEKNLPSKKTETLQKESEADEILFDLKQSPSPRLLFDAAAMQFARPTRRVGSMNKQQGTPSSEPHALHKDTASQSTGPVVSESTVEDQSDGKSVYLVRVQF